MIPKITHQIWMQGFENIPEKFKKNVHDLHTLNPEYEHKQWDEKTLRNECSKYSDKCLERFDLIEQMIMKVDLGRYVVLYNYGGISVDTDMVQIKPIRNTPHIYSNKFIISKASFPLNKLGYINNAVIISPSHNEILKNIIDNIVNNNQKCSDFLTKEECVQNITGPVKVGNIIDKSNISHIVLNNKYYEPCSPLDVSCKINSDAIMDHRHEGSWVSPYLTYLAIIGIFILRNIIYIIIICILVLYIYNNKKFINLLYKK
jgi:mannosyltransferase OCH1-like enzyme